MKRPNYTPGPWAFGYTEITGVSEPKRIGYHVSDGINKICVLDTLSESNARLIAAAPLLLSRLQDVQNELDKYKEYFPPEAGVMALLDLIAETVDKATGGSNE